MRTNTLTVFMLCMFSAAAQAEVIYFINRGDFRWNSGYQGCGQSELPTWLNITRAPSEQVPQREFNSIGGQSCRPCTGCMDCTDPFLSGGAAVMVEPEPVPFYQRCLDSYWYHTTVMRAKPDSWIGPEDTWSTTAVFSTRQGRVTRPLTPGRGVLAIRLTINGRFHYGWVGGMAWAYESEPDTPIQVPCIGDYNYDKRFDNDDFTAFLFEYGWGINNADVNNDGLTDFFDYLDFLAAWASSCGAT